MAIIPKPPFPNVPKLPGVPQLPRSINFPAAPAPILGLALALGKLWQSIFAAPQWAIYKAIPPGVPATVAGDGLEEVIVTPPKKRVAVVVPDSFGEFAYRNESSVSDFPVQQGEFASYNKVSNPFEISIRMYKGGSTAERQKFQDSILAIADTLDLYDIVTPEKTYLNVNVMRFETARRGPRGACFMSEVDLYFREVREVTSTYTTTAVITPNAQNASAVPVTNTGLVQTIKNVKNNVVTAVSSIVGKIG